MNLNGEVTSPSNEHPQSFLIHGEYTSLYMVNVLPSNPILINPKTVPSYNQKISNHKH